jgi:hypothetical protein
VADPQSRPAARRVAGAAPTQPRRRASATVQRVLRRGGPTKTFRRDCPGVPGAACQHPCRQTTFRTLVTALGVNAVLTCHDQTRLFLYDAALGHLVAC